MNDASVQLKLLAPGQNWMDIGGIIAVGMAGYYSKLPTGSTLAVVSGNPGELCLEAPRLVAAGIYDMAITTPLWYVKAAIEGRAPFSEPLPLCVIGVFPHDDRLMFAVRRETGIESLHDVRERRLPLKVSMPTREMRHPAGWVVEEVLAEYGISTHDIEAWGGEILRDRPKHMNSPLGTPVDPRFDAVLDEAMMTHRWKTITDDHDIRFLPLDDHVLAALRGRGMETAPIPAGRFRGVETAIPTLDFNGWAIIARTDMPDEVAALTAEALIEGADRITARFPPPHGAMTDRLTRAALTDTTPPIHPGARSYYNMLPTTTEETLT